jgi:hypothetical protein
MEFYHTHSFNYHIIIRTVALLIQAAFFVVIIMFSKFHVELILSNSTTLDNLERQRNPNTKTNVYDLGSYENFVQVFGTNVWKWPWPYFGESLPKGDGVLWKKNSLAPA